MSKSKIYVGNLSYDTSSDDLNELFGQFGGIEEVKLIHDRETGRSKGFGFITFDSPEFAQEALSINGTEFQGRSLKVSIAMENKAGGGAGGASRGGRGGDSRGGDRGGRRY